MKTSIEKSKLLFSNTDLKRLIIPLVIEQILVMLVGMVDTMMVSYVGESAISGVALVDMVNNLVITILSALDYIDLYICHAWDDHTPIEETMETLNTAVLSGKVREIGISNCYAWQLQKANYIAERNGWKQFVSMQGHYNLIFREEEREMIPYCEDAGIALTPYSPLASGRLVKPRGERTKRLEEDTYAKGKYASTEAQDAIIIDRVAEIAKRRSLTTTQVALAWLLSKVTAPIVGATKLSHIDDAASAVDAALSNDEITYLEQAYMPHKLVGVMANNHK